MPQRGRPRLEPDRPSPLTSALVLDRLRYIDHEVCDVRDTKAAAAVLAKLSVTEPPRRAKIVHRRHSGAVQERTPVQRLVDTLLDRAEANNPSVEYVLWMPSLESLLLPRDNTREPRASPPPAHPYRTHRVQPFGTPALTIWVSPATGAAAPSYAGNPLTEHITAR